MDWPSVVAGLLVGIVVGLTGVGGGSLMSPLLILLFGVPPATAIGTDLWFAAVTKAAGGYVHHRHSSVDFKILGLLAAGSIPMAVVTGLVLWQVNIERVGPGLLVHSLGIVLVATALATLFRERLAAWVSSLPVRRGRTFVRVKTALTVGAGGVLGTLVTLTSVGAGALGATFLLMLYPRRMTLRRLVGTDIAHAVPIAIVGGALHFLLGTVDFTLLGMLLIGSLPGIVIGSYLAAFAPESIIRPLLAIVLAIAGIKLIIG